MMNAWWESRRQNANEENQSAGAFAEVEVPEANDALAACQVENTSGIETMV